MSNEILKNELIESILFKINKVIDLILEYYDVNMTYNIDDRNKLFCEIIRQTKTKISSPEMFERIQTILHSDKNLDSEESDWLYAQIHEYHRDIFLLHYFYAVLYSYNYDIQLREKITEEHLRSFFLEANQIYKKYKNLMKSKQIT